MEQQKLRIIPIDLRYANRLVSQWHRHHKPARGHRFSLAVVGEDGIIHGAVIVGRPVARGFDYHTCAEVTRLVTDGTPNACSALYAAASRVAKEMGFVSIHTYILDSEPGTSLKASGWQLDAVTKGGQWIYTNGKPRRTDQPISPKQRWSKTLNPPLEFNLDFEPTSDVSRDTMLF